MTQIERPSFAPLSPSLEDARTVLTTLILEPEVADYFNEVLGFYIRSAEINETPGKGWWIAAESYKEDEVFLGILQKLDQKTLYELLNVRVEKDLARARQARNDFLKFPQDDPRLVERQKRIIELNVIQNELIARLATFAEVEQTQEKRELVPA